MDFYNEKKENISTPILVNNLSYYPKESFLAALNFSKAIKNELIKVHNYAGVVVGYAVEN
jgi:hypothetical protein